MRLSVDESQIALINELARPSEEAGQLLAPLLELLYSQQWFKIYVPKRWGGVDTDFPAILRLLEAIAHADGSAGWVVTLCSGASWFAGFWAPELVTALFQRSDTCITGSGAATGTAVETPTGYRVDGFWKHATGALHATHFTANCVIKTPDGAPVYAPDGQPLVRSFLFTREEVTLVPTWSTVGMVATGSHGFSVRAVAVGPERSFVINGPLLLDTNAGNYPFLQLSEATLTVNFAGMATHFLELLHHQLVGRHGLNRFTRKQADFVQQELARQQQELADCRAAFYHITDQSWQEQVMQKGLSEQTASQVSRASRLLVHTARRVIDQLYPYGGLDVARTGTDLNRVWRDLHTASQHALLTFEH